MEHTRQTKILHERYLTLLQNNIFTRYSKGIDFCSRYFSLIGFDQTIKRRGTANQHMGSKVHQHHLSSQRQLKNTHPTSLGKNNLSWRNSTQISSFYFNHSIKRYDKHVIISGTN